MRKLTCDGAEARRRRAAESHKCQSCVCDRCHIEFLRSAQPNEDSRTAAAGFCSLPSSMATPLTCS